MYAIVINREYYYNEVPLRNVVSDRVIIIPDYLYDITGQFGFEFNLFSYDQLEEINADLFGTEVVIEVNQLTKIHNIIIDRILHLNNLLSLEEVKLIERFDIADVQKIAGVASILSKLNEYLSDTDFKIKTIEILSIE